MSNYLSSIEQDLSAIATNPYTREALHDFKTAWNDLDGDKEGYLQDIYIHNKHLPKAKRLPAGEKDKLYNVNDGTIYAETHSKYHPWFHHFQQLRGYYDIFLVEPNGDLVYSVFKEADYATNLNAGDWKDTDLANSFRTARDNLKAGYQAFFDFRPYAPSANAPASFISQPVLEEDGSLAGVLIFQMPIDQINGVMQVSAGMGESGETYIVGPDYFMRSDSRFAKEGESTILKVKVEGDTVSKALQGEQDVKEVVDYRGIPVLSAYGPIDFHGVRWAVMAEIDVAEAMIPIKKGIELTIIVSIFVMTAIGLIGFLYARSLTQPINNMVVTMKTLADGDNTVEIPSLERADEIGGMANAVQVFKENAIAIEKMQADQERREKEAEEEKRRVLMQMADDFDMRTADVIKSLTKAAGNMKSAAEQMNKASQETEQSSGVVASAATEADSNVQTVAAATEELTASSSEIARQVESVASKASQAASEAEHTSESVHELNELADSIGEVVGAIKDIAEQTNLLALNATIEAARAGDAGKGFAVVADEVKKLAMETAQKTEQIDERVGRIQEAIHKSVQAMNLVIDNVKDINGSTASVASAVEEQNSATDEIGRNVNEASTGTRQVSEIIENVRVSAGETGEASGTVLGAAEELSSMSDTLQKEVNIFLAEIRGDGDNESTAQEKPEQAQNTEVAAEREEEKSQDAA